MCVCVHGVCVCVCVCVSTCQQIGRSALVCVQEHHDYPFDLSHDNRDALKEWMCACA